MSEERTVLIVLDTLRKDYADRYIWPVLKKYGFVKYDRAVAPAPWTTPSHVSMLTGLYPLHHGVHHTKEKTLPKDVKLKRSVIEKMAHRNLEGKSALISANVLVSNYYGYDFDIYYDATTIQEIPDKARFVTKEDLTKLKKIRSRYGSKLREAFFLFMSGELGLLFRSFLTKLAYIIISLNFKLSHPSWPQDMGGKKILSFLRDTEVLSKSRFTLINFMEAHEPYTVFEISTKAWGRNYDKHAKYLAGLLQKTLEVILDQLEDPDIIILSDHGQLLGDYNLYGHGFYLYDELIRVPLYTNFRINNPNDWFSLKNVYHLILKKTVPHESAALSEYFGIFPHDPDLTPKHRIAVYYKDYKGIFNVDEWKWESWKTYNGEEEVPEEIKREMMKIVVKHLKTAVVKDRVKKLIPKEVIVK